ncbi:MAG: hypothetical protein KC731_40605, partial [Myxococcales bacterium]|nr:hypothetical protein [Myxococcales bacterium]
MRRRALLGWLALAGVLPVASCDCSGGTKGDAPQGAGSVTATPAPPPKLVSRTFHLDNGLEVDLATGPCGERLGLALLLSLGIDHDPDGRSGMVQVVAEVLKGAAGASPHQPKVELGEAFTLYTATPPADALPKELEAIAAW